MIKKYLKGKKETIQKIKDKIITVSFCDKTTIDVVIQNDQINTGILACLLLAEHRKGGDPTRIIEDLGILKSFTDKKGTCIFKKPRWR